MSDPKAKRRHVPGAAGAWFTPENAAVEITTPAVSDLAVADRRAGELCVLVACGHFLVAIPVRWVVRLLLPSEVDARAIHEGSVETSCLGTLRVEGEPFVAWDLGSLLGVGKTDAAWVLLRLGPVGRPIPLALRTGACLMVQPLRPETSLPGTIFRARGRAFPAAFDAVALRGKLPTLYGLWLDPNQLLTRAELEASAKLVAQAQQEGAGRP